MRSRGRLTEWNDDRGFGFVTPLAGGSRRFVHVSAFPRNLRRPMVLDLVTYDEDTDDRGRPRAVAVQFMSPTTSKAMDRSRGSESSSLAVPLAVAGVMFAVLVVLVATGIAPLGAPVWYVVASAVTFFAYAADKSAAQQGEWRVSEATLHGLALLGGWPGAFVAQQAIRHKTRKQPFQTIFWVTVVLNVVALGFVLALSASARAGGP